MREQCDVLLVNPGDRSHVYQSLSGEFSAIEPPSLAALFATYLRRRGQSVAIIDAPANNFSPEDVAKLVLDDFDATLIVLVVYGFQPSASTQNMTCANATARAIKELVPTCKILMTGTHPAALPERTLNDERAVDFVCSGEGPRTITALAEMLKANTRGFVAVPDLWQRVAGVPMASLVRADLIPDGALDAEMPGGAWDLLPMEKYRAHNWHAFGHPSRQPYVSIHTSLGCPYRCTFCCINAPFGKSSYRMWSPDTVGAELELLVRQYGVRHVKFVDEMFVLNKAHVLGVCDEIERRGLGDQLNIWAYARIDTVKGEFLDRMWSAGFRWLALGIESASKHVRDGVEKGRFGSAAILDTVRKVQSAGINVIGNFIFGLPDDTTESMQETLALALESNCEFANFYSAMAYPGSKLYADARASGAKLPAEWIGYSQHSFETEPLATATLSSAEVLAFRDHAFKVYFSSPAYQAMVRSRFGQETMEHIQRMVAQPLPRRLFSSSRSELSTT